MKQQWQGKIALHCIASTVLPQKIPTNYQTPISLLTSMDAGIAVAGASHFASSIESILDSQVGYGGNDMLTEEVEKKAGHSIPAPVKAVFYFSVSMTGGVLGSKMIKNMTETIDRIGFPGAFSQ